MATTVNLWDFTNGQRRVMGTVRIRGNRVVFDGEIPPRIREMLDDLVQAGPRDPAAFLDALPARISGTYLRAEIVD